MTEVTQIVKTHEGALLRYAARILRNEENARDTVQEAFIRFVRVRQQGKEKIQNVQAWLFRITRNLCLDQLRAKKRQLEISLDEEVDGMPSLAESLGSDKERPDKKVQLNEAMQMVRQQIMALDPRSREIVVLKLEQGRSYKEIAEIMNLKVGNVGFILHQAMKKLATGLSEYS